jgi:hypothetical protein
MTISKLQAAERQLNCAIRLYFADDDLLAVHTLSRAAFRILFDIYPERSSDGFDRDLDKFIAELGWRKFNRVTNFLKHADNDADAILDDASEAETKWGSALPSFCIAESRDAIRRKPWLLTCVLSCKIQTHLSCGQTTILNSRGSIEKALNISRERRTKWQGQCSPMFYCDSFARILISAPVCRLMS